MASEVKIEIIDEKDFLLRRVPTSNPNYIKPDGTLTSAAFKTRRVDTDGLSVDLERLSEYKVSILDESKFALYKISAQLPINDGLACKHVPTKENYAHSLIEGGINRSKAKNYSANSVLHENPKSR